MHNLSITGLKKISDSTLEISRYIERMTKSLSHYGSVRNSLSTCVVSFGMHPSGLPMVRIKETTSTKLLKPTQVTLMALSLERFRHIGSFYTLRYLKPTVTNVYISNELVVELVTPNAKKDDLPEGCVFKSNATEDKPIEEETHGAVEKTAGDDEADPGAEED